MSRISPGPRQVPQWKELDYQKTLSRATLFSKKSLCLFRNGSSRSCYAIAIASLSPSNPQSQMHFAWMGLTSSLELWLLATGKTVRELTVLDHISGELSSFPSWVCEVLTVNENVNNKGQQTQGVQGLVGTAQVESVWE